MQDVFLAESLFRVFDEDKSGALNFYEFLQVGSDQIRSVQTRSDQAQIQHSDFETDLIAANAKRKLCPS